MELMTPSLQQVQNTLKPHAKIRGMMFRSFPACMMLSLLGHLLGVYAIGLFGPFELHGPVRERPEVSIILEEPEEDGLPGSKQREAGASPNQAGESSLPNYQATCRQIPQSTGQGDRTTMASPGTGKHGEPSLESLDAGAAGPSGTEEGNAAPGETEQAKTETSGDHSPPEARPTGQEEKGVRRNSEFMTESSEKLTYRITLRDIPAGKAVIEASNSNGELRITTRVTSNEFVSAFYPVDDFIDTRLIKGNYLVTRVRQREGGVVSDTGFTLMLRERTAFWVDRLRERYLNTPLPREDVTDLVTGFYFLRNLSLEVGKSVVLHLFDGGSYAPAVVEVVRRERLKLPGFREAEAILVHPNLSTSGFFAGTGPLSIWLTDDERRVPVRLETSIRWGRVRMELVSAESCPSSQHLSDVMR